MNVRAGVAWIATGGLLAACGSQVPPKEFFRAQGGLVAANGSTVAVAPSQAAPRVTASSGAPSRGRGVSSSAGPSGGAAPSGAAPRSSGNAAATGGETTAHHRPAPTHTTGSSSSSGNPSTQACRPGDTTPSVKVCPHSALRDGQTVTVEGWGFKPNTQLAVAECRDRGNDTNLSDCNIDSVITYAPGAKVTSDAHGHIGPLRIVLKKSFKDVDCGTESCLVAVSEPTLSPDPSDEGDVHLRFA